MHTTHLMRPLFSSSLPLPSPSSGYEGYWSTRWPNSYSPSEANIVFVDPGWKDLEETIFYLRAHPEIAQGIAERQRELVPYLSPAAETCYWRALIKGWSEVAKTGNVAGDWAGWEVAGVENGEGMRWETFSLKGKTGWK